MRLRFWQNTVSNNLQAAYPGIDLHRSSQPLQTSVPKDTQFILEIDIFKELPQHVVLQILSPSLTTALCQT